MLIPKMSPPIYADLREGLQIREDQREFVNHETSTWAEILRFGTPCDCVYAFSPDLALLVTSERAPSETTPIVMWDTSTGEQIQLLQTGKGFTAFCYLLRMGKCCGARGSTET